MNQHSRRWRFGSVWLAATLLAAACTSEAEPELGDPVDTSVLTSESPAVDSAEDAPASETTAADPTPIMETWASELSGGAVVSIARNGGDVATFAAGAAANDGTPLMANSQFRVGSISKTFVATMVLQLVDDGQIDLDGMAASYLEGSVLPAVEGVTVRQLLTHTSGLPSYTNESAFFGAVFSDAERAWEPAEILELVAETDAEFDPGARHAYSNTNFIVLGQMLETVTGQTLEANLQQRIAGPLGLTSTTFDAASAVPVTGYSTFLPGDSTEAEPYTSIETSAWAAGELVSTGPELAAFLQALARGELMSDDAFTEMRSELVENGYGLGIFPLELPSGTAIGHGGAIPGFTSMMAVNVETGDLLVIVSNDDFDNAEELARRILRVW